MREEYSSNSSDKELLHKSLWKQRFSQCSHHYMVHQRSLPWLGLRVRADKPEW
jgi:hypothetical protein